MSFAKLTQAVLLLLMGLVAVPTSWAQTYTVLYSFTGGKDGASPAGGLILDTAGNLYGTAAGGSQAGSVYKLSHSGKFVLLHSFGVYGAGGAHPSGGLVEDSAGNLYGATSGGGTSRDPNCFAGGNKLPSDGCGVVFKLDANGNFSVLFSFSGKTDCWKGCEPLAPLTLDAAGNLYGTTFLGGSRDCDPYKLNNLEGFLNSDCGVVFKLDTTGNETVLHRFGNAQKSGDFPNAGFILDAAGNLYGTTEGGGINTNGGNGGAGAIFKLDPTGNETVLHFFEEFVDGDAPQSGLIQDGVGNFYGTTAYGGNPSAGSVYKLDPQGNLTQLFSFPEGEGGQWPFGRLTMDAAGNLYGTTIAGGNQAATCNFEGCGVVFKLDPSGHETVLHGFTGGADGGSPQADLVMDAAGNLYGTAPSGGAISNACPSGCGVVFKITP